MTTCRSSKTVEYSIFIIGHQDRATMSTVAFLFAYFQILLSMDFHFIRNDVLMSWLEYRVNFFHQLWVKITSVELRL